MLFVDELLEAYPDAKIVLLTREAEAWAKSVRDQFTYFLSGFRWTYLRLFDKVSDVHTGLQGVDEFCSKWLARSIVL